MIGVVVINYHSEDKTIEFVRTELPRISEEYAVVIVDNGSTENSRNRLLEAFKGADQYVFVVPSEENLGFAKGNNLGAKVAINQFKPDILLFANNDIRITGSDTVADMAAKLRSLDKAGALGPKVLGLDGRCQSPEPFISFYDRHIALYFKSLFSSSSQAYWEEYSQTAAEGFHYRISGSFFMVKTDDYAACGGMDPNTFLYAEEMILSERLKRIDKGVYYYPEVSVIHEHGATTKKYYDRVKVRELKYLSEKYYYKTYIGTPWWQFEVADLIYALKKLVGR